MSLATGQMLRNLSMWIHLSEQNFSHWNKLSHPPEPFLRITNTAQSVAELLRPCQEQKAKLRGHSGAATTKKREMNRIVTKTNRFAAVAINYRYKCLLFVSLGIFIYSAEMVYCLYFLISWSNSFPCFHAAAAATADTSFRFPESNKTERAEGFTRGWWTRKLHELLLRDCHQH